MYLVKKLVTNVSYIQCKLVGCEGIKIKSVFTMGVSQMLDKR